MSNRAFGFAAANVVAVVCLFVLIIVGFGFQRGELTLVAALAIGMAAYLAGRRGLAYFALGFVLLSELAAVLLV